MEQLDRKDWAQYCGGDKDAFDRVFNRNRAGIYRYSLSLTGDHQLSEDIVQECFVRLIRHQHGRSPIQSIKNWLFICARNMLLNHFRDHRTKETGKVYGTALAAPPTLDVETREFIRKVLESLEPRERDLILLREQQQFSITELSEMLDKSPEAVRVDLYRVRKKMQRLAGITK